MKELQEPTDKQILQHARRLIAWQEKNDGLFFIPKYITEAHLQHALRELHCVIKGDIYFKNLNREGSCKKN